MFLFQNSKKLITFVQDRKGHDLRYAIDFSKTKSEIGWQPKISFIKGLKETIEFYYHNFKYFKKIFPYH